MLKFLLLSLFGLLSSGVLATHNRSGEITYKHLGGNTYEFTITTCTKLSSEYNRTELEIDYGDGAYDTLPLTQFIDYSSTDTKKNIYVGQHTFSGPGTFLISVSDPNRNAGILNIQNSVEQIFCIQTQLIISPFLGKPNNSLQLQDCPCPEEACAGKPWIYNLGAFDPDGDSLSYELIPCKGEDCINMPIPSVYQFPQNVGGGTFFIDPEFGTITWDSPSLVGEYNFAIKIKEFRNGALIGFVIRDMQLTVKGNCSNNAPEIIAFADTCVRADSSIIQLLTASDSPANPNDIPVLTWDYFGEGFQLPISPAVFTQTSPPGNPISAKFEWTPGCSSVRNMPYLFTFEASDQGPFVVLKDIESVRIKVNGPAVIGLTIQSALNASTLSWNKDKCSGIKGYNVYRKLDSAFIANSCCEENEAKNLGYQLLGTTASRNDTVFIDSNNLYVGNKYCYTVTAVYQNETESCLTPPVCIELPFDLPVITHVTINTTDLSIGADSIRWTHPKNLDTNLYKGPYQYKVYRAEKFGIPTELIYSTLPQVNLIDCDTFYIDIDLNTEKLPWNYRIEFLNASIPIGKSAIARSIFLEAEPNDNQILLKWKSVVPWTNFKYEIYRSDNDANNFVFLGTSDTTQFLDDSLINGQIHCYKIRSIGRYSLPSIPDTIYNWSQYLCISSFDFTAPCAPSKVSIEGNCLEERNTIRWLSPNKSCSDDVVSYQLYYSSQIGLPFELVAEINNEMDTFYVYQGSGSIAGCYYVTATDSAQYGNVSPASNTICIDNCEPNYKLPNVFTPNGDKSNDLYHPIAPIKFIAKVEFRVYNRWGEEVFYTEEPKLNWNGFDQKENLPLLEGVYFYTCKVFAITLNGLTPFDLTGFIHLIYSK